ncbi:MAG: radical SAM protein [Thermoplasmata archaeon]
MEIYNETGFNFKKVYIGGGTPTVDFDELILFLDFLHNEFNIKEISIETTPRELNEEKINELKNKGVNRLSVGVQTLNKELLIKIGRVWQSPEYSLEIIKVANEKIDTLTVDLMFNFKDQLVEDFERDLDVLMENNIKQITAYPLMPSIYSHQFKNIDRRKEKEFYFVLNKKRVEYNYDPHTVWSYLRYGYTPINEYIIDEESYIGLGSSGISYMDGTIRINTFSLEKYVKFLNKKFIPTAFENRLDISQQNIFFILNKLFSTRVDKGIVEYISKRDLEIDILIKLLELTGIVHLRKSAYILTEKRYYVIGNSMRMFFSILNTLREDFRIRQI